MSYDNFEQSLQLGQPIELYEFIQGLQRWFYVSGVNPITRLGQVYQPVAATRDRIKQTSDIFKDGLKMDFPREDAFANQFLGFAPEEVTTLTILRGHFGDPDEEFRAYWKGRVVGAKAQQNTITVECESVFTSIRRPGLRARFEYGCRHTLYGRGCGVNRESYKVDTVISAISNELNITGTNMPPNPDGYFTGGMLVAPNGATRFLTAHTAQTVTMNRPIPGLAGAQTVSLYPGCDHLRTTCESKFNNLDNFGGFPFIPQRNPFDGSSIV